MVGIMKPDAHGNFCILGALGIPENMKTVDRWSLFNFILGVERQFLICDR